MKNTNKKLLICIIAAIAGIVMISVIAAFLFNDKNSERKEPFDSNPAYVSDYLSDTNTSNGIDETDAPTVTSEPSATPSFTVAPTQKPVASDQLNVTSAPVTASPDIQPTVQPTADINYDNSGNVQIVLKDSGSLVNNNNGGVKVMSNGNVYITKEGEYDVSGTLTNKSLVVEMPDTDKAIINFKGVNISSSVSAPISLLTGDKVEISAVNGSINNISDNRAEAADATGDAIDASVDLEIKGKGTLNVTAKYNNGIDTSDDLEIKNLTLKVTASNNALKGNDSVTVESGNITVISTKGDGIKTTNTEISSAGNQRGIVTVLGGTINIYAACDGIDASYDAVVSGGAVNVYTASFSDYSESLPATATVVASSSRARPQRPGTMPGGPGGGGMNDGNPDSTEYSCKGIKAENSVKISGGTISVKAADDAIHTNNEVDISGGSINLHTNDDGIHGNTSVTVSAGKINIEKSYEGIEGTNINIKGGTIKITSSDDALNANATSSYLNISGGVVYFNAGGDGIDSNSNVVMSGGAVLAQGPSNGGNGVIDYDRSFSFKGGLLLVVGANGMNQKPSTTSGNTVLTKNISTNTSSYVTLTVDGKVAAVIKITKNSQSYCVAAFNNAAYGNSGIVSVSTSTSVRLTDGLYYVI